MKALIARYPVLALCTVVLAIQFAIVVIAGSMIPDGQRLHDAPAAHMVFRFRVFWPLVFAVLITYYIEGREGLNRLFGSYRVWRVPGRFFAFALTWKFLFCYLAWAIADIVGLLPWPGAAVEHFFTTGQGGIWALLATMPYILGIALVEETTWMKYCVTRLQARYTAFVSGVLAGIAWGLWYLPMLLLHEGVPDGVPWYMFLLSMVGLTLLLGWAYNMTHSGLVLLIMQVVSNIAFFVMPALPTWHNMDASYVTAFIWVEVCIVGLLVLRYGTRDLGLGPRAVWNNKADAMSGDGQPEAQSPGAVIANG